jgi:hypothetical protein
MKPDRPLIISILFLAGGLWLIFGYAHGTAGLSAALPITNSTLHINVNTTGLAALGGIVVLAVGVLLLIWSLLAAIVSQLAHMGGGSYEGPEKLLDYRSFDSDEDEPISRRASPSGSSSMLGLGINSRQETNSAGMNAEGTQPSGSSSLTA